jgi:hypothetical protein
MAVQRYKIGLNASTFPLVTTFGERTVMVPALDTSARSSRFYQGSDENLDFNIPQILYGENFIPVARGVKSVSYSQIVPAAIPAVIDFDQIFPLRDQDENTVLYSPAHGQNYVYNSTTTLWTATTVTALLTAELSRVSENSTNTALTAKVTRAYVEGKTFVCYSRLGTRLTAGAPSVITSDGSLFVWDPTAQTLISVLDATAGAVIANLSTPVTAQTIPLGAIDGISSSNGYLIAWSGLTVYWAPFNGIAFDFVIFASGEITGSGFQIPEDLRGPITAIVPVSGGFIIFTTKNAVAAFYNANNFASPWIFKAISNAGGVESFEQTADDSNLSAIYAYTTGGMQKISLNSAETVFPDVTDFLGLHYLETFNPVSLSFERGALNTEMFVKVTHCGQRFLVISYGMYPGVYSYALVYDNKLDRWGKLRIPHRDCFAYSYGQQDAQLTYGALLDVPYEEMLVETYGTAIIQGGALTYPRQSIAFMLRDGSVKLARMDMRERDETDTSQSFILVGRNQLTRARLATVHEVEVEGFSSTDNAVSILRTLDGLNFYSTETGYLRERTAEYAQYGFDCITGKTHTVYIGGQFYLANLVLHATNDGAT